MLPSFRLIVLTFACSFALVFASLKLMDTSRVMNEPISVPLAMLPQSDFPVRLASFTDRRRADDAIPLFDRRFGERTVTAASIPAGPTPHTVDRPADQIIGRALAPAQHEYGTGPVAVAAPSAPALAVAPEAATIDEPVAMQPPEAIEPQAPAVPVMPVMMAALEPPMTAPEPVASKIIAPEPAMIEAGPEPVTAPVASEPQAVATPDPVAVARPEPTPNQTPLDAPITVAALHDPTDQSMNPPDSAEDLTASIDPDRQSPEAVPTAGTSRPVVAHPPRTKAKAKAVRTVIKASKRKLRAPAGRRPIVTAIKPPPLNPFSPLFSSASQ